MRLYASLTKDTNEQEVWIINREGEYSTPLMVMGKYEVDLFIKTIQEERINWKRDKK